MKKKYKKQNLSLVFLIFFLGSGVFFYVQIPEFIGGIHRFLIRKGPIILRGPEDLPEGIKNYGIMYSVKGTPDYKYVLKFPRNGQVDNLFRMVGFENKLLVSTKQLETPTSINQILTPQTFTGPLCLLEKSPLEERLRRGFKRVHNIELPQVTYLLFNGMDPEPSLQKFIFLCLTGMVGIISFFGIIKRTKTNMR